MISNATRGLLIVPFLCALAIYFPWNELAAQPCSVSTVEFAAEVVKHNNDTKITKGANEVVSKDTRRLNNTGFVHSPVVYAHVHMAKTAGTEINGELAVKYERVCGHKGYSYDAHKHNDRGAKWVKAHPNGTLSETIGTGDLYNKNSTFHRGRVNHAVMDEIGYQDCDWISIEKPATWWTKIHRDLQGVPIEMHVPCRNPVDHLLSMCNYKHTKFPCEGVTDDQIPSLVDKCALCLDRFKDEVLKVGNYGIQSLKCFNPIPIEPYLDLMSTKLQKQRIPRDYVPRATNQKRDKASECLRTDLELRAKVEKYLIENIPIFRFCDKCMGSKNDLLASS